MKAVTLYVVPDQATTDGGGGDGGGSNGGGVGNGEGQLVGHVWQPPLDVYFARRINAECRVADSVDEAAPANLLLFALAETMGRGSGSGSGGSNKNSNQRSRIGVGPQGEPPTPEALAECVADRYKCIRWVEKDFTLEWTRRRGSGSDGSRANFVVVEKRRTVLQLESLQLRNALRTACGCGGAVAKLGRTSV